MCSKVLNGHIILTDTSITTILAPEMTYTPKKTPKDPSQWKFEKFSDHSVRWTYRVTNADYDEAVRQTEERWAEKDDGE